MSIRGKFMYFKAIILSLIGYVAVRILFRGKGQYAMLEYVFIAIIVIFAAVLVIKAAMNIKGKVSGHGGHEIIFRGI